jgi:hypothetical protein
MFARGGARNQVLKGALVAVVVMGDIARSPRMVNHARELASNGFAVVLIGYRGREFEIPAGIRVISLDGGSSAPRNASGLRFAMQAGLRTGPLFVALFRVLLRERTTRNSGPEPAVFSDTGGCGTGCEMRGRHGNDRLA